jgi:hypothetical protein
LNQKGNFKADCVACGAELVYQNELADMACIYCGGVFQGNVKCANGHYVCDNCHSMPAEELIERASIAYKELNPLDLAVMLMGDSRIKMHGPEHHFLVPAVLLSCYYNKTGDIEKKSAKIAEARKRASHVHGGFCGFYGSCGAAMGTGIFISLILDVTPLSKDGWKLANMMTSKSLNQIAEYGGPRCCKRDSYLAIIEAAKFISENLQVALEIDGNIKCGFDSFCRECTLQECPFYPR